MRRVISLFLLMTILSTAESGCDREVHTPATSLSYATTPVSPAPTLPPPTPTREPPMSSVKSPPATSAAPTEDLPTATSTFPATTPPPKIGGIIVVTDTADSGPGTLRQALEDARPGDTITFDADVFPPKSPATIYLARELPPIEQGHLVIDASSAGVILDGGNILSWPAYGLQVYSDSNAIRGMQIVNFSEGGVILGGRAQHNTIGGNRNTGAGPLGQGNLISGNGIGIGIWDDGASFNTVTGNLIGTDAGGADAWGNNNGIIISEGANYNSIGPDNIIAHNGDNGIAIVHPNTLSNTITQNSIHSNGGRDIILEDGGNNELVAPLIIDFDLDAGTLAGSTCAHCTVEIFSNGNGRGDFCEGRATGDGTGVFTFSKSASFAGSQLTATATDPNGNTSQFSPPTSSPSGSIGLQAGNYLPITPIQHRKSQELESNDMGDMYCLYPQAHTEHPGFEDPDDSVERIGQKGLK